jgi:hypothetical protein
LCEQALRIVRPLGWLAFGLSAVSLCCWLRFVGWGRRQARALGRTLRGAGWTTLDGVPVAVAPAGTEGGWADGAQLGLCEDGG